MKLNREEFLAVLQQLKPAIADNDIIPLNTHVWFTGTHALASNNSSMGIRIPFKVEFTGGVRGLLLLGFLANTTVDEVTLEPNGDKLALKAGKARLELATLPIDQMPIVLPDEKLKAVTLTEEFIAGLGKVEISTKNYQKSETAEVRGVTVVPQGKELLVFGTDSTTVARAKVPMIKDWPTKDRMILPVPFVKQITTMAKEAKLETSLTLYERDSVMVRNKKALAFSPQEPCLDKPVNLVKITNDFTNGMTYTPIPARLKLALARADVLLQFEAKEGQFIQFNVNKTVLTIYSKTAAGELKDTLPLDNELPQIELLISPVPLQRGLALCDKMGVVDKGIALEGENFTYIIARVA